MKCSQLTSNQQLPQGRAMCGKNEDCGCSNAKQPVRNQNPDQLAITASLVAAADARLAEDSYSPPERFDGILTVEGVRTTDRRRIEANTLTWRKLPWNVMAQFQNDGHRGAEIVGNVESITREPWDGVEGGYLIKANGSFDLDSEHGRRAAAMVDNQTLRFGSIDLEALKSEFVILGEDGEQSQDASVLDLVFGSGDEEFDFYDNISVGRIMGWTLCPMPAFPQAVVVPEGAAMDIPKPFESEHHPAKPLLASAGVSLPEHLPSAWFDDPELEGPTSLHIEDNGRIFGHLALWDTRHLGYQHKRVTPPKSEHDYAYFKQGKIETVNPTGETELRSIGHITFDVGHADSTASLPDTVSHYDNTGSVAADIAVGEDEYGIWFTGALRNGLSTDDVRTIRAAPLSGDWRRVRATILELVAVLSVNVPGFPIVASAGMVGNDQVSLLAAAVRPVDPIKALAREVQSLKKMVRPSIVAGLQERVGEKPKVVNLGDLRRRVNQQI